MNPCSSSDINNRQLLDHILSMEQMTLSIIGSGSVLKKNEEPIRVSGDYKIRINHSLSKRSVNTYSILDTMGSVWELDILLLTYNIKEGQYRMYLNDNIYMDVQVVYKSSDESFHHWVHIRNNQLKSDSSTNASFVPSNMFPRKLHTCHPSKNRELMDSILSIFYSVQITWRRNITDKTVEENDLDTVIDTKDLKIELFYFGNRSGKMSIQTFPMNSVTGRPSMLV